MTDFQREKRYLVLKISDIDKHLTAKEKDELSFIEYVINLRRATDKKPPLECVVIEHDWPEYETVWKMIEQRMEDKT